MNQGRNIPSAPEAELWLARSLSPGLETAEQAEFEVWRQDPRHAAGYDSVQRLWEQLEPLRDSPRLRAIADQPDPVRWRRFVSPLFATAAAAAAAVAVVLFTWLVEAPAVQTYSTAIGQQRTEVLEDGSQIVLNTSTTVDVEYSRGRRHLTLRSGEAIFEVAQSPNHPFVVRAGKGEVTALGTRFHMRRQQDRVAVTLLEGSVRVMRLGTPGTRVLVPGQQAVYADDAGGISARNVDVGLYDCWTRGRLEFRFTPLAEAVAEANRYSTYPLRVEAAALKKLPVSGSFRAGDTTGMAAALEAAYPVRAEYGQTGILLTPR